MACNMRVGLPFPRIKSQQPIPLSAIIHLHLTPTTQSRLRVTRLNI
ncbi:unnamed protein product, partial [Vitis vinifera]|uniref:Uncharacterized protein n=1 Tax=Vitis vinifera TaxID=29760 RepID=E0CU71_VITVI